MANKASLSMVKLDSKQTRPPDRANKSALHSASIHISSFPDAEAVINPQPWRQQQEEGSKGSKAVREPLNQGYLSPMKLVQLTEVPDLSRVTYLELSINTSENSVGNFGTHLPNLVQLRFTDSSIACVRDLGTSLHSLKVLWMSCCKLKDLDGLPALQNLQEFYLPFNDVEDISVITMLSSLDVLDLESNNLTEEDQLGYLALCPSLISVTLEGNPLSVMLAETLGGEAGYRAAICEAVPSLQVLDDVPLCPKAMNKEGGGAAGKEEEMTACSSLFALSEVGMEKDWHILQQSIKQGLQLEQDVVSPVARPMTAPPRRSFSISPTPPPSVAEPDESSELTHGLSQVICGNPVRALRARKQHGLTSQSAISTSIHTTTPPYSPDEGSFTQFQDLSLQPISEDIMVTRAKSEENLLAEAQQPVHLSRLPTPPRRLPTPQKRLATPPNRLPTPPKPAAPSVAEPRPKSVADFRHKRYRKSSVDTPRSIKPHRTRQSSVTPSDQHDNVP